MESIYEKCELEVRGIAAATQQMVFVEYKGLRFEEALRFDILVESCLLVKVKAVEGVLPVHKAVTMSYMKLLDAPIGLIFNFHEAKLTDGISRLILPGANLLA